LNRHGLPQSLLLFCCSSLHLNTRLADIVVFESHSEDLGDKVLGIRREDFRWGTEKVCGWGNVRIQRAFKEVPSAAGKDGEADTEEERDSLVEEKIPDPVEMFKGKRTSENRRKPNG